jgi:hypothetical protein
MKILTLMTTVAAAAIVASSATAQTSDQQRREMPGATQQSPQQSPSATDQNSGGDRSIRDVTPTRRPGDRNSAGQGSSSDDLAGGRNETQKGDADQERRGQNAPAQRNGDNAGQNADRPARSSENPSIERKRQSTQNPSKEQPSSAQTTRGTERNRQSGQQPSRNEAERQSRDRAAESRAPSLNSEQRTRFASAISRQNAQPITKADFSINAGVSVPSHVHLTSVPAEIVEIVPQYRGYSYFVTNEQIVIVEPRSHRIVYMMPYEGRGHAASTSIGTSRRSSLNLTREQREAIRRGARPAARSTTGSSTRRTVTIEEEVPSSVELETFDEPVIREVPAIREYRYYRDDDDVVIVDPSGRRVLDVVR